MTAHGTAAKLVPNRMCGSKDRGWVTIHFSVYVCMCVCVCVYVCVCVCVCVCVWVYYM